VGLIVAVILIGNWGQGPPFKPRIWPRPEEKQGKFYQLLTEEEKVSFGCCLIPTAGCIIGYYNLKQDKRKITEEEPLESLSFWQRLEFGIGYSGGVCLTGKDLRKYTEWTMDPITLIGSNLYWLNSIEISALYKANENRGIEVGLNYGWAHLKDRVGWFKVCSIDGKKVHLRDLNSCKIKIFALYLKILNIRTDLNYSECQSWELPGGTEVLRRCLGGGLAIEVLPRFYQNQKLKIYPFVSLKISGVVEIWNNSLWKEYWKRKLFLNFSGIYGGIRINYRR